MNPGCRGGKPATNRLSYSAAIQSVMLSYVAWLTLVHSPRFGNGVSYLKHSKKKKKKPFKTPKPKNQARKLYFYMT
jgi:hypothetical protein